MSYSFGHRTSLAAFDSLKKESVHKSHSSRYGFS